MMSLIKYEFQSMARVFLPIYAAMTVFCIILGFSDFSNDTMGFVGGILFLVVYALVIATAVMSFVLTIQRFSKNLLGKEGYLMLTLPVKTWELIVSKLVAAMSWNILSMLCIFLNIMFALNSLWVALDLFAFSPWTVIMDAFLEEPLITAQMILLLLVQCIATILLIYTSISAGHIFNKNRRAMSFCAFIVFMILQSMIQGFLSAIFRFDYIYDVTSTNYGDLLPMILLNSAMIVIYFFTTNYLIKNYLNLE